MLPDPVIQAAQVLANAMPLLAMKAYRIALAVEPCDEDVIYLFVCVNEPFLPALVLNRAVAA
jgi:hypothetical protein